MYHPIKEQNMHDLAEYQRGLWKKPRLQFLFFELTDHCNLHCRHCGSKCTPGNSSSLDFSLIKKVLKNVSEKYDPHRIMVCLTGGEPMCYGDIFRVIAVARSFGFLVGMTSNGTLINKENAMKLYRAGLNTIAVSIDGVGQIHDDFRNAEGSFEKALNGIRALNMAGLPPEALTVVHHDNIEYLEDIYQVLSREDVYSWRLASVDPIGRAARDKKILLSGKELKYLYEYIREKRFSVDQKMQIEYACSHFVTYEFENEIRDHYFQCNAGLKIASIMVNGDIGACLDIERRKDLIQGNAYTDVFTDVWENRFQIFRQDRTAESPVCVSCVHRSVCMGDSFHTWDCERKAPNYCVYQMLGEDEHGHEDNKNG